MMPTYDYTFTKDPSYSITKKYFIEWITVDEHQETHVVESKDFDSFKEACNYNNTHKEEECVGYLFRNRRWTCQIK